MPNLNKKKKRNRRYSVEVGRDTEPAYNLDSSINNRNILLLLALILFVFIIKITQYL